jgi:anti-anti-sigma factor
MALFETSTSVESGRAVVALTGECDLAAREALTSALHAAIERAEVVDVDLAALRFLDSSGVHCLIAGHHTALRRGGRLYVVNAHGAVAQLLDVTGVGDLLRPPTPA